MYQPCAGCAVPVCNSQNTNTCFINFCPRPFHLVIGAVIILAAFTQSVSQDSQYFFHARVRDTCKIHSACQSVPPPPPPPKKKKRERERERERDPWVKVWVVFFCFFFLVLGGFGFFFFFLVVVCFLCVWIFLFVCLFCFFACLLT